MSDAKQSTDRIEPYVWKIAGVVILGMMMSILDTTIVNVALDTLSEDLHSTIAQIQWVATGYLLALAAVIPLTGWSARRFGAKRVYLASIVLFTIGSALCGLAESSTSLILFRVLQGVGGGMIMPISQMIMAEVAGPKRMGKVMSVVVMPAMLAPILGPVVGGLILAEPALVLDLLRQRPDRDRRRDPRPADAARIRARRGGQARRHRPAAAGRPACR